MGGPLLHYVFRHMSQPQTQLPSCGLPHCNLLWAMLYHLLGQGQDMEAAGGRGTQEALAVSAARAMQRAEAGWKPGAGRGEGSN